MVGLFYHIQIKAGYLFYSKRRTVEWDVSILLIHCIIWVSIIRSSYLGIWFITNECDFIVLAYILYSYRGV